MFVVLLDCQCLKSDALPNNETHQTNKLFSIESTYQNIGDENQLLCQLY